MYSPAFNIAGTDTVRDIVLKDYRTADVFEKYNIAFSSKDVTLHQICFDKGLNIDELKSSLTNATRNMHISNCLQFEEWKIDFLIDYIKNVHYEYTKKRLPIVKTILDDLSAAESIKNNTGSYLQLKTIKAIFKDLLDLVVTHINSQESSIFPYIKQIYNAWLKKESYGSLLVRTLRKPVEKVITNEHSNLKELLYELRKTTNQYSIPNEICIEYKVAMKQLQEFDDNLVQHIYLEKDVLFPKVLDIEKELIKS